MDKTESIRNEVETALMNDDRTQDATVDVISNQGIVTLLGEVESTEIAQAAEDIATNLDDVIKVINNLVVKN
ncbi:MAG: BON domain-containing protein [Anaerolineales bacterium]